MTIKFDETIRAIWFAPTSKTSDFLAALSDVDGQRVLTYRFRYYIDDSGDPWADDEKHWYRLQTSDPFERVVDVVRSLMAKAPVPEGGQTFELLRGDRALEAFMNEFGTLPFVSWTDEKVERAIGDGTVN